MKNDTTSPKFLSNSGLIQQLHLEKIKSFYPSSTLAYYPEMADKMAEAVTAITLEQMTKLLEWMGANNVRSSGIIGYGSYHVLNDTNHTPQNLIEAFNNRDKSKDGELQ